MTPLAEPDRTTALERASGKLFLCTLLVLSALITVVAPAAAQNATFNGGGFTGPSSSGGAGSLSAPRYAGSGPALLSVAELGTLEDDARVVLRGSIVQHLGGDRYAFEDKTGRIRVKIKNKNWEGRNIGPGDAVELHGELDKDDGVMEISTKRLIVLGR